MGSSGKPVFLESVSLDAHTELVRLLQDEIQKNGPIPFARFMEQALYHHQYGYYMSACEPVGTDGDYYTSVSVHPVFGERIAQQILQMADILSMPLHLVEIGAGNGQLCSDILKWIRKSAPEIYEGLRYEIVEKSPHRMRRQQHHLAQLFPNKLGWSSHMPEVPVGVVLSNELVDAMPVHRLRIEGKDQTPQERYVHWNGAFEDLFAEPSSPRLLASMPHFDVSDGPVEIEISLAATNWMREIGAKLARGFVITIDYGDTEERLYGPWRPKGTFLCYFRHQANDHPYRYIGHQDMTAHVNFSALSRAGREVGLLPLGFIDQTRFLLGLGIGPCMEEYATHMETSSEARRNFLAMKQLMSPTRMGGTFKVFIQGKNTPPDAILDGLQYESFRPLSSQQSHKEEGTLGFPSGF